MTNTKSNLPHGRKNAIIGYRVEGSETVHTYMKEAIEATTSEHPLVYAVISLDGVRTEKVVWG